MVQTSVQFTPVQVLQAARRAEAEGKMDYALQFYRHLVEQHGTTPEAQEAREGLFRIAEWRWGEARVARGREAGGAAAPASQTAQTPPARPRAAAGSQRVYNVANKPPPQPGYGSDQQPAASAIRASCRRSSRASRAGDEDLPPFRARFSVAKFCRPCAERHRLDHAAGRHRRGRRRASAASSASCRRSACSACRSASCWACRPWCSASCSSSPASLPPRCSQSANAQLELVAIERGRTSF